MLPDVRSLSTDRRHTMADRVRTLDDFTLPDLDWFNSAPCERHPTLADGQAQIPPCRRCGIAFRKHQRIGIAWLYLRGKGLIADQVGSGKTGQAAGLIALMKQVGELDGPRVVIIVRPSVLGQWYDELNRFLPDLAVTIASGTAAARIDRYLESWDILLIGFQMFVKDAERLHHFNVGAVIVDDIDALRNRANQTAYAIKRLARAAARVVVLTGTPLQKRLPELHSVLEPVGGLALLGSETAFRRRFVREELHKVYNARLGRIVVKKKIVGYRNLDEFKTLIAPLALRRTAADIDDVDLPVIAPPNNVYLDLYPAQRERYEQLRQGVMKIIKAEGARVKHTRAVAQFVYGAQICAGLTALGEPDRPGTSIKLDWVENIIVDGDLSEEKVVVFAQFTNTVAALAARLTAAGVGHAVIWGRDTDKDARRQATTRFWDDPDCRVLIGTSAIEQGLNLQVARHLINIDQLMNPARMQQLAGRIRRDGSAHKTVYIHNLLARATQEEGYLDVLAREQALADHVWNESNQLYERLNPLALLHLIGRSR